MSIVELITNSIDENGFLPENFELPSEGDSEGVKFAAGAMDGICMYHMGHNPLEDDEENYTFTEEDLMIIKNIRDWPLVEE